MTRCSKPGCKFTQWSRRGLCYAHEQHARGFVFDPQAGRFVRPESETHKRGSATIQGELYSPPAGTLGPVNVVSD